MAEIKKRKTGRWIALGVATVAIGAWMFFTRAERITPWMEYVYREPLIDAPHLVQSGPYVAKVRVKNGLFWTTVLDTDGHSSGAVVGRPHPFDDGHAALVQYGMDLLIYREGVKFPVRLDVDKCPRRYPSHDSRMIVCLSFNFTSEKRQAQVTSIHLDFYNSEGKVASEIESPVPLELRKHFQNVWLVDTDLIGYDSAHRPVIVSNTFSDAFERYLCAVVVLDPAGMREAERKSYRESVRCPRESREWGVVRNGGMGVGLM